MGICGGKKILPRATKLFFNTIANPIQGIGATQCRGLKNEARMYNKGVKSAY